MAASLAVAIGLSASAAVGPAVAQDAPHTESSAAPPTTSDQSRHHKHKHDDKAAESAAKAKAEADAGAKTPAASSVDSSAVAVVKPPEQECRSVRPTGTRMSQKICATPEQWKEVDAKGAEGARQTKQTINDSSSFVRSAPPLP